MNTAEYKQVLLLNKGFRLWLKNWMWTDGQMKNVQKNGSSDLRWTQKLHIEQASSVETLILFLFVPP